MLVAALTGRYALPVAAGELAADAAGTEIHRRKSVILGGAPNVSLNDPVLSAGQVPGGVTVVQANVEAGAVVGSSVGHSPGPLPAADVGLLPPHGVDLVALIGYPAVILLYRVP